MNLSYWEIKSWLSNVDFTIIGSGIVGLSCALQLKSKYPNSNILILEKGILPQGASTKNAGFACFGSISEIIDDLKSHSEDEVLNLIKKRYQGLQLLRENLGDSNINYKRHGGYEVFLNKDSSLFESCLQKRTEINKLLKCLFNEDIFLLKENSFNFYNVKEKYIFNKEEGQIDTGKMMETLILKVQKKGIKILNNTYVEHFVENNNAVKVKTNHFEFTSTKLCIATNGFASQLLNEDIKPARAQVVITKPIQNLHIKGTFHLDRGYYYFRNIDNRILFGGGRHLDFKGEETSNFGETSLIQKSLENLLETTILPNTPFEIEHRWSGIMGIGNQKKAIIKQMSNNVYCGVRLGGMGVAIGSQVGKELAELTY